MVDIWRPIALRIPFNLCCVALSLSLSLSLWLFPSLVPSQCQWPHAVREPRVDLTGSFLYSPDVIALFEKCFIIICFMNDIADALNAHALWWLWMAKPLVGLNKQFNCFHRRNNCRVSSPRYIYSSSHSIFIFFSILFHVLFCYRMSARAASSSCLCRSAGEWCIQCIHRTSLPLAPRTRDCACV